MVSLLQLARVPSLEPVRDALEDAIDALFDSAEAAVAQAYPGTDIELERPAKYQFVPASYEPPSEWPALLIGAGNLHRTAGDDEPAGGEWLGSVELHIWLQDDDPDRLMRKLCRYAAVVWMAVLSADAERALGGVSVLGQTLKIDPYPDPGQSLAQQAIVVGFDVTMAA